MSPEEKRILQLTEENELLNQKYEAVKEQLSEIESQKQASCK